MLDTIRSVIFHVLFLVLNVVLCTCLLWSLLLPRRYAYWVLFNFYFRPISLLERLILNLRFEVIGKEHIPLDGSYIVVMKHQSVYETLKMFHIFGDIRILLKKELAWLPLWGWYALKIGMISVDRGKGRVAIQSILNNAKPVVEAGVPILIYPQGTRVSIDDTVVTKPYKQGAINLYKEFNIPILPVAMNSGKFWPRHGFIIRSGTVTFKILPLISTGQNPEHVQKQMQELIETESIKLL